MTLLQINIVVFLSAKLSSEVVDFEVRRDIAVATTLAFYIWGAHWHHLANTTEPSMCDGDAALCQITLTTCYYYFHPRYYRSRG